MVPGRANMGGAVRVVDATKAYGALRAIDPTTGERRCEFRYTLPTMAGVMTTAAGLVFAGDNEGNFMDRREPNRGASVRRHLSHTEYSPTSVERATISPSRRQVGAGTSVADS